MEYVEISKVIDIELGKTPSRNNTDYWNGKNTWITIADMTQKYIEESKEKITDIAIKNTKIKKVPQNTVIMSFKLSIGKRAITKAEVYTNEAIAAFHIKDLKSLIPEYLYYALESVDFLRYTDKAVKGKTLNKEKLKKIRIPIFSLSVQLKISEILNKIQKIIENKRKQIFLLEELVKSRFIEMFFKNKKYIVMTLEQLTSNKKENLVRGPFGGSLKKDEFIEDGYLVYEQKHAIYSNFNYQKYYISKEKYQKMLRFKVESGDLIVSCSGTLGKIAEIPKEYKEGIINQALLKIKLDKNIINNKFFMVLFRMKYNEKELQRVSLGSGISNFPSMKEVRNFDFIVPPLWLQNEFAEFATKIDKLKIIKKGVSV